MPSAFRGFWQAFFPLWFFLVSALAPMACTCAPPSQSLARHFNGDGVGDLIQCEDHSDSPEGNPSQPAWTLHLWRPGGFLPNGVSIEPLAGIGCGIEMRTVDLNRNGIVLGVIKKGDA